MNKNIALPNFDFADSEFRSFDLSENNELHIYLTSWDERLIIITFANPIFFSYVLGYGIDNIYFTERSNMIETAINLYYEKIPEKHGFKFFEIIDLNDHSFVQVVAESINVIKCNEIIGFKSSK